MGEEKTTDGRGNRSPDSGNSQDSGHFPGTARRRCCDGNSFHFRPWKRQGNHSDPEVTEDAECSRSWVIYFQSLGEWMMEHLEVFLHDVLIGELTSD